LEIFTSQEVLKPEDAWYCPKCEKHQEATKKIDLWKLPNILILHLKRFNSRSWKEKLETLIDYPIDLDLTPYLLSTSTEQNAQYELYSVVNHSGASGVGHYTAYCNNSEDKNWYCFNDITCRSMETAFVKTKLAYLLFYRRKSTK